MPIKAPHLLWGLLAVDGLFFILYFGGQFFNLPLGRMFVLSSDWSLPEVFQYFKELSLVALLLVAFIRSRKNLYIAWMTLFGYLLLDDALMIREWLGNVIAQILPLHLPLQLRSNDFGETIALASFAALLLPLVVFMHLSSDKSTRKVSWLFLPWLLLLGVCGYVFDMVHSVLMKQRSLELVFGFLEDGGEMLVMSGMVWVVYTWFRAWLPVPQRVPFSSPNLDPASTHS
jgi:hypothetical protein